MALIMALELGKGSDLSSCVLRKGITAVNRLLAITLTDGKRTVKTMEYKPLALPKEDMLPPGTKIQLTNPSIKAGVILLEEKVFKV